MSAATHRPHEAGERGFILPGVVMFVIVLTILGLSLFALSSYEAQFMNASLDQAQAFYSANGAIDRARFLLMATKSLASVSTNLGAGVDHAVAIQDPYGPNPDSTGDWTQGPNSNAPILIRVVASKHGQSRSLEAQFDPNLIEQYDKLFAMSSPVRGLHVMDEGNDQSEYAVGLDGKLWQTYAGQSPTDWSSDIFDCFNQYSNGAMYLSTTEVGPPNPPVPAPQVQTFLSTFPAAGAPQVTNATYSLDGVNQSPLDSVGFFRTSGGDAFGLDINTGPDPVFSVRGIAVWAFDRGLAVEGRKVIVQGTSKDMLVLVAHQEGTANPLYGLWFDGGIDSPTVPVILVSDQRIMVDSNQNGGNFSTTMGWLGCYAPSAWIHGPKFQGTRQNPTNLFLFYHPTNNPYAEHNLDKLFEKRALPNVNGPRNSLAYQPGTWRELPTN